MDPALREEYLELLGLSIKPAVAAKPAAKVAAAPEPVSDKTHAAQAQPVHMPDKSRRRRLTEEAQQSAIPDVPATDTAVATLDWDALAARVAACTACGLHQRRTQTVFGVGAQAAPLMLVGEGPGEQEDLLGEPFVGAAGQLLDNMLSAIGRSRAQDTYIANVVKCRPPGNRKPQDDEAAACGDYLDRQIALVEPKLLVALGGAAATRLLGQDTPVGKLRGQIHDYRGMPVIVTYHPAYYLRKPADKRKGWDDLKRIRALLAQGG